MANNESFLWGLIRNIRSKRNKKRMLKNIAIQNQNSKKIVQYQPSPIEYFFSDTEPLGNIVVSGGSDFIRNRAIIGMINSVVNRGISVVILHIGNQTLENGLTQSLGGVVEVFNRRTSNYEPLAGLSNAEICRVIQDSATKSTEIRSGGQYYLEGVTEFIRSKNISPYCDMFITCPHLDLFDMLDEAETKGRINNLLAQRIKTMLMQGQPQRSDVENYFNLLRHQAQGLLATKPNLYKATSLRTVINNGKIGIIDLGSNVNDLLLNLILCDLSSGLKNGKNVVLVLDGISISASEHLDKLIKNSGIGFYTVISSNDVYASLDADDKLFATVVGKSSKSIILQHISGLSCSKWAETIGYYEKKEISDTYTDGKNYQSMFSIIPGQMKTSSVSVNLKRDYIVRPEEINHMASDEVYIVDTIKNELAHSVII